MTEPIYVSMLGGFSITRGENRIDDSNNRMRKVWLLLAYLIYSRRTRTTQEQYLTLTQGPTAEIDDPAGRLKALFYRARAMLDPLGPRAGHELILHTKGNYGWNTDIPLVLDVEEFDRLYTAAGKETEESRLELLLQALDLYQGDFLPKLSMESWAMPISAYYHQRYLEGALQALSMLCEVACSIP